VQPLPGVKPYPALELAGRDIYVREGCYNCHSQMVRTLRFETERYGHYSLAGESVYDRPFQWGSKRTGPDLARVGGRYSDDWHRVHLNNPRDVVPESNMPASRGWRRTPWMATPCSRTCARCKRWATRTPTPRSPPRPPRRRQDRNGRRGRLPAGPGPARAEGRVSMICPASSPRILLLLFLGRLGLGLEPAPQARVRRGGQPAADPDTQEENAR
jgi:hypothetical protein